MINFKKNYPVLRVQGQEHLYIQRESINVSEEYCGNTYKKHSKSNILDPAITLLAIYPKQINWHKKVITVMNSNIHHTIVCDNYGD